jgi:REP element-mobilizing transposase RayT
MPYDPNRHHRRSIRLKGYDYSQAGAYFITLCTQDRACLFGKVVNGEMRLNDAGRMVLAEWNRLPERFPQVVLDAFVVMPNHVHGILVITDPAPTVGATVGATLVVAPTVGNIIGAFKSRVTVEYIRGVKTSGWPPFRGRLWQRNYYEHIIRNERALNAIRQYIMENPRRWHRDREKEARSASDPLAQAIRNMPKQEETDHSLGGEP